MYIGRIAIALATPLLLVGCLLQPGKFTSDLVIKADRSFTFSYKGEVYAVDPTSDLGKEFAEGLTTDEDEGLSAEEKKARAEEKAAAKAKASREAADLEVKRKAAAEALAKEAGYRSVQYLGNGKYLIDYSISGVLGHNFTYPFNTDAEMIIPFIAVELRGDGKVRMMAPAFAASSNKSSGGGMAGAMGMGSDTNKMLDGVFTLTTNAEVVMHNNEDGPKAAGGMKTFTWRATPLTKDAPTAVLKLGK